MGRISMPQGRGSQLHNRREYAKVGKPLPDNIDASKAAENVVLIDMDIRQAYKEIFGEALEQYNGKQKRADRKIEDYYEHIQKSKNGEKLFYEDVVQWGKKEDFQDNPELIQKAKEALLQYATTFQERNPNLKLVGAYLHMDEASPHLHIDYVPVAHGYSRGLATRNSLDRAMKEMGFKPESESRKHNATKLWKESERAHFGDICRELGLEVEEERKSTRKSLSVEEYKEARDEMMGEIELEKLQCELGVQNARKSIETIQTEVSTLGEKKDSLEGEISFLEAKKDEVMEKGREAVRVVKKYGPQIKQLKEDRNELEKRLPALRQEIEAAKEELEVTKMAAKALQADLQSQFSGNSVRLQMENAREEIAEKKRISKLEKLVATFERFLEKTPIAKGLWHKFLENERHQKSDHNRKDLDR